MLDERPFSFADEEWAQVLAAAEAVPVLRRKQFLDLVVHRMSCSDDVESAIAFARTAVLR